MLRRDWTKDYRETVGADGRKRYVYIGKRYELPRESRRTYQNRVMPVLVALLAAQAAWGLIDTPASRTLYVALTWAAVSFSAALALFDAVRILLVRRALTARDYTSSALRLKRTLLITLALSALQLAMDLVYLILKWFPGADHLFFIIHLLVLGLSILAWRHEKQAIWNALPPTA